MILLSTAILFVVTGVTRAQQTLPSHTSNLHAEPSQSNHHTVRVDERGDKGMGFSHATTTHHFRLYNDGGAIGVEANDPKDEESKAQVRSHLQMIARKFKAGDFSLPMFIHATTPPGMKALQRRKAHITYRYEQTTNGAQVRLLTKDRQARNAIHAFLRFQINDHRTGDQTTVQRS